MARLCVIPARMDSSRFPGKPMAILLGKPMLGHVYARTRLEDTFDRVVVATCDTEIKRYCDSKEIESVMTSHKHERASDRVQEAVEKLEHDGQFYDSVTLVQGDEPMVTPRMLRIAVEYLERNNVDVVNLRSRIHSKEEFLSLNCVKVVVSQQDRALYFTRSPVPASSKPTFKLPIAFKQVCIIPFRRSFLDEYSKLLKPTYLEEVESIDMNRVLEHDKMVYCVEIDEETHPVDTEADLKMVSERMKKCPLVGSYISRI